MSVGNSSQSTTCHSNAIEALKKKLIFACRGMESSVSIPNLLEEAISNFYEGISAKEIEQALLFATKSKIEIDPTYDKVAMRLLLDSLYRETIGDSLEKTSVEWAARCNPDPSCLNQASYLSICGKFLAAHYRSGEAHSSQEEVLQILHQQYFKIFISECVTLGYLKPSYFDFDLDQLSNAIRIERDDLFKYLGLQVLYDRYFIRHENRILETPQIYWMRVAMGLSLLEGEEKTKRAVEFYNILSQFLFMVSTPALWGAGAPNSQMISCYLSTIKDDLQYIFKVIADNAQISKWAGGVGNDWTNVRAMGAHIKGTNEVSQGVIPFLKVVNDTAVAVNQGGRRKGAICAYLETWHLDIENFLELRKSTGDERRRTHDMNTANWIPDLFMKRVRDNSYWTLFSPNDISDLHDLYGKNFEQRYVEYEQRAMQGEFKLFKRVEAVRLWRKMLSMLYETGHPWIVFKDCPNIRSQQDHVGIIHSANLCTEIFLNSSNEETAVCNLGSVNFAQHVTADGLDEKKLASTIKTAVRIRTRSRGVGGNNVAG